MRNVRKKRRVRSAKNKIPERKIRERTKYIQLSETNIEKLTNSVFLSVLSDSSLKTIQEVLEEYVQEISNLTELFPKRYRLIGVWSNGRRKDIFPSEVANALSRTIIQRTGDTSISDTKLADIIRDVCVIDFTRPDNI